jgi:signal transduction histidine kinase
MRGFIIILFIILIFTLPSIAQKKTSKNDSLSSFFSKVKIDRLNNAAHNIYLSAPDSAREMAAEALLLAGKAKYDYGKGESYLTIGLVYWSQSYYPISLFYLKSALSYFPKTRPLERSDAYRSIGRTYADLKKYKEALLYLDTALYYAGNDTVCIVKVISEKANVYSEQNDYKKALNAVLFSLKLNRKVRDNNTTAVLYSRLSNIYNKMGNYTAALAYNDTALLKSVQVNNLRLRTYTYIEYARVYNNNGHYDDAIPNALKAMAIADKIGAIDATYKSYQALINSYSLKNDLKEALSWQKKYNVIRDSLNNVAKLKTIKLIQNYYDLNSRMNNISLMEEKDRTNKAKIQSQYVLIEILMISLVVLVTICCATFYFYKQKKILSSKLQQQHKELLDQKQLIEVQTINLQKVNGLKDKLLAVIGHDLRTPVANLSNIIEMFDDNYLSANEVRELMKDISPIIKGAELTLSNLLDWAGSQIKGRNIHSSNIDIYLLGLEMEQTFAHDLQLKKIDFINQAYPGRGVYADENHLKVILRNLISNAIKFTEAGNITLSTLIENNELIVNVTDSGKGMTTEEIDRLFYLNTHFSNSGTSGEKGTGIGLLLCKELVELNGGKLSVKSVPGQGSTFYFNLPMVKAYA